MDYNPFRSGRATQQTVQESKFLIPEEIPATERTAFHGAAAGAHRAGKSHFTFAGKKYPVTMKKDTANAIADQTEDTKPKLSDYELKRRRAMKARALAAIRGGAPLARIQNSVEEGYFKDLDTEKSEPKPRSDAKVADDFKKRRKMNKADGGGKEGDVTMNPKSEQKESRIRSVLKSILERKDKHSPNQDKAEKIGDNIKGQGAKDMMAAADNAVSQGPEAHLNEPEIDKKTFQNMTKNVPNTQKRKNDNPQGDKKIVPGGTPFKDPAAMKAESFSKTVNAMKQAYASMYEKKEEEKISESMLGHGDAEKLGKSKDPSHDNAASHIDHHLRRHSDANNASGGDRDKLRYQVAKKLGYDV